jgi:hypothetical protein
MTRRENMEGFEMQSTMMTFVRQRGGALKTFILMTFTSKTFTGMACAVTIGLAGVAMTALPASALIGGADSSLQQQFKQNSPITEVVVHRGGAARRTTVVGPRGGAASRTVVRHGAVVRPGVGRPGAWVRPARYTWRPGGAIAAGAAVGFVTAATAVAWAGAAPAPGYCWYYTDPSRTQGFWDVCPQ